MKNKWFLVVSLLVLIFIWSQSSMSVAESSQESKWLLHQVINPFLEHFGIDALGHRAVRKLAHVAEFFVLSVFVSQFWNGNLIRTLLTGFVVAFLDESIQLFSDRSALITDVWIDLIGVIAGAVLGSLIWWLAQRIIKRKARPDSV